MVVFYFAAIGFYQSVEHVDLFVVLFDLFAPIALTIGIVALVLCITAIKARRLPRIRLRAVFGAFVFLLGTIPALLLYKSSRITNPTSPAFVWTWTLLLPHATWLFFVTWLTIVTIRGTAQKRKRIWEEQPSLQRLKTADISAEGIIISDIVSHHEIRWEGFVGWQETKTIFSLFVSEHQAMFFPKTAFASDEEREAMRALARLIPTRPSTAFPVLQPDAPSPQPPPLPALNPAAKE